MVEAVRKGDRWYGGAQQHAGNAWIRHCRKHTGLRDVWFSHGVTRGTINHSQISSMRIILVSNFGITRPTTRADCPTRATGLGGGGGSATMRLEGATVIDTGTLRDDGR